MRKRFKLPDREKLAGYSDPWKHWNFSPGVRQHTVPSDPQLLEKLGIEPGSNILVFAGYAGDWARALQKKNKVFYTDASQRMVEGVKKHKGIKRARVRNAMFSHRAKNTYDWSFSFEPIPLIRNALPLACMRALLNRKGLKIVLDSGLATFRSRNNIRHALTKIEKVYRASLEEDTWPIRLGVAQHREHTVFTLKTNPDAREKAHLDVRVLRAVEKFPDATTLQIAKKLGVKGRKVKKSLERLNALSSEMKAFTKEKTMASRKRKKMTL